MKQELDTHHFKLSSHQPYKVRLLLIQEENEDLLATGLGRGDSEGLASLLLTLSRLIQEAEFVFRCSQHPQVSSNAYCSLSIPKA